MMRFRRLDLVRYGKFTDHAINFGPRADGYPDLHIVYGPNEAGKSTTLAAVVDLLFGIETRSPYAFLHPYPSMRLGAALDLSTGEREVFRIKRPQNSLLDSANQPISEAVLRGELGGMDRDSYRTMFSLDDDTLEKGGESILASEGDLGELLFSASAGLADLGRRLGEVKSEADAFYRKRARSGELGDLKKELESLKEERGRIDTLAVRYGQLKAVRDRAAKLYEEAITERGRTQARITEIQRLLAALPRLIALRLAREQLVELESLPEAPLGIADELSELRTTEVELATRSRTIAERIRELSLEMEDGTVDEVALALSEKVSRLSDSKARYLTAIKDIPERLLKIRETDVAIDGILRRMGCERETGAERLILGASVVGALRDLLESRSGIVASLRTAEAEVADARRRVDEARAKLEAAGSTAGSAITEDAGAAALASAVTACRANDYRTRLRLAERALATHQETLFRWLRELKPWEGDPRQLLDMEVPGRFTIDRWKSEMEEWRKEVERHDRDLQRLVTERGRLKAKLKALENIGGVVTDGEAAEIRAARNQAWSEHRKTLDASSADRFEALLQQDDLATNARFLHVKELAELRQGVQAAAVMDADITSTRDALGRAKSALDRIEGEIAEAVARLFPGSPPSLSIEQLEAWLKTRENAILAFGDVCSSEEDRRAAKEDGEAACERLKAAMDAAAVKYDRNTSFERLLELAQAAVDQASEARQLRREFTDRQRELAERERGRERVVAEDQNWKSEWAEVCSNSWLADSGPRSVSEVREILPLIGELSSLIEKKSGLVDRVAKMEKDRARFTAEVRRLADDLGIPGDASSELDLASSVESRVRLAESARDRRLEKEKELSAAQEKQRNLAEAMEIHERRKARILEIFGVATLPEVETVLKQLEERATLKMQADAASADIMSAVEASTVREAEESLENTDRAALEAELAELQGRFTDQDQRSRELFTEYSKAVDAVNAIGDDDAVARIEERRHTVVLEIQEKALRYLKLRIGIAAAEQALRLYRDRHRSSMMARASEAFNLITLGRYDGLTTQPEKDNEILVAVDADGGSKVAATLSKGTRFQLYLALRVAGYHEFVSTHHPVPFLADDIMETFDDFRAAEAFRLLAQMAEVGQVIYFTHHQHLCEIARKVCPSVMIHELPQTTPLHLVEGRKWVA